MNQHHVQKSREMYSNKKLKMESESEYSSLPSPPYSEEDYDIDLHETNTQTEMSLENTRNKLKVVDKEEWKTNLKPMVSIFQNHSQLTNDVVLKSSKDNKKKKVKCYSCELEVDTANFKNHLFFGTAKCNDCGWTTKNCTTFSKSTKKKATLSTECNHSSIIFSEDTIDNLKKHLNGNKDRNIDGLLFKYLNSLKALWDISPWKNTIYSFKLYLDKKGRSRDSILSHNNNKTNKVTSQPKKIVKLANTHHVVRKPESLSLETLQHPTNGHYLILRKPIEECPECYTSLSLEDLIFDCSTGLISTSCRECNLSMYFVIPPSDGSQHDIKIIF